MRSKRKESFTKLRADLANLQKQNYHGTLLVANTNQAYIITESQRLKTTPKPRSMIFASIMSSSWKIILTLGSKEFSWNRSFYKKQEWNEWTKQFPSNYKTLMKSQVERWLTWNSRLQLFYSEEGCSCNRKISFKTIFIYIQPKCFKSDQIHI